MKNKLIEKIKERINMKRYLKGMFDKKHYCQKCGRLYSSCECYVNIKMYRFEILDLLKSMELGLLLKGWCELLICADTNQLTDLATSWDSTIIGLKNSILKQQPKIHGLCEIFPNLHDQIQIIEQLVKNECIKIFAQKQNNSSDMTLGIEYKLKKHMEIYNEHRRNFYW